jgi:hypothetical protein
MYLKCVLYLKVRIITNNINCYYYYLCTNRFLRSVSSRKPRISDFPQLNMLDDKNKILVCYQYSLLVNEMEWNTFYLFYIVQMRDI